MNDKINKKRIISLCSKIVANDDQHSEQGYEIIKRCIENHLDIFHQISDHIAEQCSSKDMLTNFTGNLAASQLSKFILRYLEEDFENYQKEYTKKNDEK